MRLTTRGKVVFGSLWVAGAGLGGWFFPIGWWV